jgi:hypothetical protein
MPTASADAVAPTTISLRLFNTVVSLLPHS